MSAALAPSRLLSASELADRLAGAPPNASAWRELLKAFRNSLYVAFRAGTPASELIGQYTSVVDELLIAAWRHQLDSTAGVSLLAVGGYGRGELLPHSDIDLLILYAPEQLDALTPALERFVAFAWDMGLEVGHSVRSPAQCSEEAAADVTVLTNLMEHRLLAGESALPEQMITALRPEQVWPAAEFFTAKRQEQLGRYRRYDDSAYKLEPNVKEGPGGLRDIQIIGWVTQRHTGTVGLEALHAQGLLTSTELNDLLSGRAFLWQVRFALHMLTGRTEDRLLFDHQMRIAELFGYQDKSHNLAVEQFMQLYYRTIKGLSCLNDIFLQLIEEEIFHQQPAAESQPLNAHFALRHGFIENRQAELFTQRPLALLEIFQVWASHEHLKIKGISAATLREMRRDRNLIAEVRDSLAARECFMQMLSAERGVVHSLRRMNRYGILGRYIPAFGQVIGRMQYDLFHTLTVDEHTLFVVRNIRRLVVPEFRHEFPPLSELMREIAKPEVLVIAGLFHDIAKGRGGDHSELGADDARQFCDAHGLASADRETVAWLVRQHLLMSMTAQRQDVSDPDVVNQFARKVEDPLRLKLLYLLTVCDIRATNPKLWNGFKEGLLRSLYLSTLRVLERGDPMGKAELVAETRDQAAQICQENGLPAETLDGIWRRLDEDYFLKHSAAEIAWHAQAIANAQESPCVLVRQFPERGTAVFVYMPDAPKLFVITSTGLAQLGLNILDARITSTTDGYTLDTFIVSESDGSDLATPARRKEIRQALTEALRRPDQLPAPVSRRVSKRSAHFSTPTQIYFTPDRNKHQTIMELVADDRPGLLSAVGRAFEEMGVTLTAAKVGTIGERAEDVFFLVDRQAQAITDPAILHDLRAAVTAALSKTSS